MTGKRTSYVSRRTVLKGGAAALAAPALFSGSAFSARPIKIGYVTPATGPLASFSESNAFILDQLQKATGGIIQNNGKRYEIQVITKDTQSNASRASDVAAELILKDKIDLLVTGGAPDTVNPAADQAELNEVPCISTANPWQPYFFGRKGDPKKGFNWTYHFCFGLEDIHAAFIDLWSKTDTNKVVGGVFANDPDGNAWGQALPPALQKVGFKTIDPGRYQPLTNDFSAQISAFKSGSAEIVTGTMLPPDFSTFWAQCAQQNFKPKVVTVGKAFLTPTSAAALGDRAEGLSCEVAWHPAFPFKSGWTGQSCAQVYDEYNKSRGRQGSFGIGLLYSMFEVAVDVLKRTKSVEDPKAILQAITETQYQSLVGPVDWKSNKGPVKNVCKTPIVAGQWERKTAGGPLTLAIKANAANKDIPVDGTLKLLS